MIKREQVVSALKEVLEKEDFIYAAWEGGSAATKKLDAYSDLDVMIVCKDDAVERVMALLADHFTYNYGVKREYRIPEPSWHGFSQVFYQIKGTDELFYLDIAVIKESIPDKFTDTTRHGQGVFWFMKKDVFDHGDDSLEVQNERCKSLYKRATEADFIMITEVKKAIKRGVFVEAFPMYYGFMVRQLGVMLNLKNRKEKVDFNLRYISRDYGKKDLSLVEDALKVSSMEELARMFEKLLSYYEELKESMFELYG
jgi:predicted nucleotidyltransferase